MAWSGAQNVLLAEVFEAEGLQCSTPASGTLGQDGDCLVILGMQRDNFHNTKGHPLVPEADAAAFIISQIIVALELRKKAKWAIALVKDSFPSDHCVFEERMGKRVRRPYCLSGSAGASTQWRVRQAVAFVRSRFPRRVVVAFKNYHEQIHSPSAFPYTKEVTGALKARGIERDREMSRLLTKLYVYTGAVATNCPALAVPFRNEPCTIDAPPSVMSLVADSNKRRCLALHDALFVALGKRKIQRLLVMGLVLEEDVIDTVLCAKEMGILEIVVVLDACKTRLSNPDEIRVYAEMLMECGAHVTTFEYLVGKPATLTSHNQDGCSHYIPKGLFYLNLFAPFRGERQEPGTAKPLLHASFSAPSSMMRSSSGSLLKSVPVFDYFRIVEGGRKRDPRTEDVISGGIPLCDRLGHVFAKWLGRDVSKSTPWRHGTPSLALRTRFPSSVTSLNFTLDPAARGLSCYGKEVFRMKVEEAIATVGSLCHATSHGAFQHIRHVLAKVVTPDNLMYFALRLGVPLRDLMDPTVSVTEAVLEQREKEVEHWETHQPPIPDLGELAAAKWDVVQLREQCEDWQTDLFISQQLAQWIGHKKDDLPSSEAADLDKACSFSLAELSTLGCTKMQGLLFTSATRQGEHQMNASGERVQFVIASPPDFTSSAVRAVELGKYFEGEGTWRPGGRERLQTRMKYLWRCVLRAFNDSNVVAPSLTALGCFPKDIVYVPPGAVEELVVAYLDALFSLLEENWGFETAYLHLLPDYRAVAERLLDPQSERYALLCEVVLHDRDPKSLCHAAARSGLRSGLLIPGDAAAVVLSAVGGDWEEGRGERYGIHEDVANSSTLLLGHMVFRAGGMQSERMVFHSADACIEELLGAANDRQSWDGVARGAPPLNLLAQENSEEISGGMADRMRAM